MRVAATVQSGRAASRKYPSSKVRPLSLTPYHSAISGQAFPQVKVVPLQLQMRFRTAIAQSKIAGTG